MVVTRRVPAPRSVRHLLQVASVSASVVGKTVLYVKHGRSASSRASPRRELCVLERSNSVASERPRVPRRLRYRSIGRRAPDRLPLRTGRYAWYETPKPPPPPLKPPETAVSQKCFTFSDPDSSTVFVRVFVSRGSRTVRYIGAHPHTHVFSSCLIKLYI